jgi:hypothetical protein
MKTSDPMALGIPNAEQQHAANYAGVVQALLVCEEACNACADSCREEIFNAEEYRRCIRRSLNCADVCGAMLRLLMRQSGPPNALIHAQLQACAVACRLVVEECRRHEAAYAPCQICAQVCQHCEERCQQLIETLGWNHDTATPFSGSWQ